jgi:hypothetical protein
MKMFNFIVLFIALTFYSCRTCENVPKVRGKYPGEDKPADTSRLFSPGFINTGMIIRDITMTPEMDELYFSVSTLGYRHTSIMFTRKVNGLWSEPAPVPHMGDYHYINLEPCLSYDGNKLFFLSSRPDPVNNKEGGDQDIWVMERSGDTWDQPCSLGGPVCTGAPEFYPSLTKDGTIYFTRRDEGINYIYRSRFVNDEYQEPERLPEHVNCGLNRFNAFISPDEDYLILPVAGMKESINGSADYYIFFRDKDDNWSKPLNMGIRINSGSNLEYSASVSPDKEALFFMSARVINPDSISALIPGGNPMELYDMPETGNPNIYWINAHIITELKQKALFLK